MALKDIFSKESTVMSEATVISGVAVPVDAIPAVSTEPISVEPVSFEVAETIAAATPAPEPLPAAPDARCVTLKTLITEVSIEMETSYAKGELQRCLRALNDALYWHERNIVVVRDSL